MAKIELDLVNYCQDDGIFDAGVIHDLVRDLPITFDETGLPDEDEMEPGDVLTAVVIEFTGSYEDLLELVNRYEDDPGLRASLISEIEDIHS